MLKQTGHSKSMGPAGSPLNAEGACRCYSKATLDDLQKVVRTGGVPEGWGRGNVTSSFKNDKKRTRGGWSALQSVGWL